MPDAAPVMPEENRLEQFNKSVQSVLGDKAKISSQEGLSNVARAGLDQIFFGGPNLEKWLGGEDFSKFQESKDKAFAVCSCLSPVLGVELYVALAFTDSLQKFRDRFKELGQKRAANEKAKGKGAGNPGTNNALIGINKSGETLLAVEKTDSMVPAGFKPDLFFFSVYPAEARLNPSIQEFVGALSNMLGEERVRRLDLWTEKGIPASMCRMPREMKFQEIEEGVKALGGIYKSELLKRFHYGLNFHAKKHFVILAGVSGTGKTSIVHRYAHAVHGLKSLTDRDPLLFWVRVRPDWTDPSGLLGHYDVFTKRFVVPPFLNAVLTANANPSCPVFVCLDEMNLARVEYYLADILSVMETPETPLQLHTNDTAYLGDSGRPVAGTINWPTNLFIVGTINLDETTTMPSPKVLDRAVVLDMTDIDVDSILKKLSAEDSPKKVVIEKCGEILTKAHAVLRKFECPFGYRAISEIVSYVAYSMTHEGEDQVLRLLDEQVSQKVLTKLRGTYDQKKRGVTTNVRSCRSAL